jgi:hypothetical protein
MPADFLEGTLPVLTKTVMRRREELLLRSYLRLPLLLDAHATDCRRSHDACASYAESINADRNMQWMSVERILRTNFERQADGTTLHVRPYARTVVVPVPAGTTEVAAVSPPGTDPVDFDFVGPSGEILGGTGSRCSLPEYLRNNGPTSLLVSMRTGIPARARLIASGTFRGFARRLLTEGRDRVQPLLDRGLQAHRPARQA